MANEQRQRIQVPDALREVLLEFSIAYLLEQPGDVVDFAVEYFTKLQDSRRQSSYSRDNDRGSVDDSVMSQEDDDGKFIDKYYIQMQTAEIVKCSCKITHTHMIVCTCLQ